LHPPYSLGTKPPLRRGKEVSYLVPFSRMDGRVSATTNLVRRVEGHRLSPPFSALPEVQCPKPPKPWRAEVLDITRSGHSIRRNSRSLNDLRTDLKRTQSHGRTADGQPRARGQPPAWGNPLSRAKSFDATREISRICEQMRNEPNGTFTLPAINLTHRVSHRNTTIPVPSLFPRRNSRNSKGLRADTERTQRPIVDLN
jgi:hypothetical protein